MTDVYIIRFPKVNSRAFLREQPPGEVKLRSPPPPSDFRTGLPTGALRAVVNLRLFAVPVTRTNEASSGPEQQGKDSTNAQERQP